MAGSGKGPLRIAIEDFLETSPVGQFFRSKIVEIGERFEDITAAYYGGFASAIRKAKGIPESIKAVMPLAHGSGHQGGILSAAAFAGQIGGSAASALFAPYGRLLNYEIEGTAHSARIEPTAAIPGLWRFPESRDILEADMLDLGWTRDRLEVITKLMRPRLNEQSLMGLVLREKITPETFNTEMAARGYLPFDIEGMHELAKVIPGVQDLITMAVREAFNDQTSARFEYDAEFPQEVAEWGKKQGLDELWTRRYWRSHWTLPSPSMMYEMLHRLRPGTTDNPFTVEDARTLLKTADYPRFWRDRMIEISYSPFTRVDVRRMYKLGILTREQVKQAYLDLGYNEERAEALAQFTEKYETTSGTSLVDEYTDLSLSLLSQAYGKGVIDENRFRSGLVELKYAPEAIDIILNVNNLKRVVDKAPDTTNEFQNRIKTMVMNAYAGRLLTEGEARSLLEQGGYTSEDAGIILQIASYDYQFGVNASKIKNIGERFIGGVIDRSQTAAELGAMALSGAEQGQIMAEWDWMIAHPSRTLTEAQYRAAYKAGVITLDSYVLALQGMGYTDRDIRILVDLYSKAE